VRPREGDASSQSIQSGCAEEPVARLSFLKA
jgi:hypothetical protein